MNKSHLLARRRLTREERKSQILGVFDMPRHGGKLNGLTANSIATHIGLLADDFVRELCKDLVAEGELTQTVGVHRTLKNGTTIDKVYYWRNISLVSDGEIVKQGRLF